VVDGSDEVGGLLEATSGVAARRRRLEAMGTDAPGLRIL
jgi:hypothetical protein